MEVFFQDIRFGLRMLLKNPGFTIIAILALALGIGANTAIFSVVNAVLLRPLPFHAPERLMALYTINQKRGIDRGPSSYLDFADLRAENHVFEQVAAYHDAGLTLTGKGDPIQLSGYVVSSDFFPLLGIAPLKGRTFGAEHDKAGAHDVILSYDAWQARFNGEPDLIGKSITLDNKPFTVIGIMPAKFQFPIQTDKIDAWAPIGVDSEASGGAIPIAGQRGLHYLSVVGRLKSGVSIEQARSELKTIFARLEKQYPDSDANRSFSIIPELESLIGDIKLPLLVLFSAVGCVLLIGCVNVANLLLARATTRDKEIALRVALGASRLRIVRQMLTESVLLALAGGAVGLLLALWGVDTLIRLSPRDIPRFSDSALDLKVLGFTMAVALATGLIFGIVPAMQGCKAGLTETLKDGGRGSTDGRRRQRIRSALVIGELALALMLLLGAGLLIRSFVRLQHVDPGFDPHNVLTGQIDLPGVKYDMNHKVIFYQQLLDRLRSAPSVKAAAVSLLLPLSGDEASLAFEIEGQPTSRSDRPSTGWRIVSPDYFRAMGIPKLRGRDFTERDNQATPPVVIINDVLARKYFPNQDPIGRKISPSASLGDGPAPMREIVGVVGSVKHRDLKSALEPEVYYPYSQYPRGSMALVVKAENNPLNLAVTVRNAVKTLDPDLAVSDVRLLGENISASVAQPRFVTVLLGILASIALILTAIGLYGVISYSVAQRTHEIGVRIALGAQRTDVLRLVLGEGMLLALIGVAIGLVSAAGLAHWINGMLFGVSQYDPATFVIIPAFMVGVALLACFIPARRAATVDPMIALRY